MELVPTILTNSTADLEKKLKFLEGKTQWVQIDVVDGYFAPNKTFPLEWLDSYQDKQFLWAIHLMVNHPFGWVSRCQLVLAEKILAQVETMENQEDFLERVRSQGIQGGLALDLKTPVATLSQEALFQADEVLLLAVKAGFSGQKLEKVFWKKLDELTELRERLNAEFKISVDGGVNTSNLSLLKERGVEIVYVGSAIWKGDSWEENWEKLARAIKE